MANKNQGGREDRSKGGDMSHGQGGMKGAGSDQSRDDMNRAGRGQGGMGSGSRSGGSGRDDSNRR